MFKLFKRIQLPEEIKVLDNKPAYSVAEILEIIERDLKERNVTINCCSGRFYAELECHTPTDGYWPKRTPPASTMDDAVQALWELMTKPGAVVIKYYRFAGSDRECHYVWGDGRFVLIRGPYDKDEQNAG